MASDAAIGSARLTVDGDYRHQKVEEFQKLEAEQSTTHLFVQGVRKAVNGGASAALVAVGGIVSVTGDQETADNFFGAAQDLDNDNRWDAIRQDSYAKAVHTAGSIAVTVATIPAGGAGVVFGGLQAINSARTKIDQGATLENAMTGFGIDMAAIAIGGGLNAAAAGKAARAGAPLGGAIGRAEQALGRVMQEEGRLSRALNAVSGDKAQALGGLAVDVSAMAAKGELNSTDAATSASFNALAAIVGGRRGRHMPEGAAPTSVRADATPDVRVNHTPDAEAVIPTHVMDSTAPATVMQNRVSADDLLGVLPVRQTADPRANIADIAKPSATPDLALTRDPVVPYPASVDPVVSHPASIDPVVAPAHVDPVVAAPAGNPPTLLQQARQLKAEGRTEAERSMILRHGVTDADTYKRPISREDFNEHVANNGIEFTKPTGEIYRDIYAAPKADRPDPSEYLSTRYLNAHRERFADGAARLDSGHNYRDYMRKDIVADQPWGRADGNFVGPRELNAKLYATNDPVLAEKALGLPDGNYSKKGGMLLTEIKHPEELNLRMANGTESGAWAPEWLPGGFTYNRETKVGIPEMLVDKPSLNHPTAGITVHGMPAADLPAARLAASTTSALAAPALPPHVVPTSHAPSASAMSAPGGVDGATTSLSPKFIGECFVAGTLVHTEHGTKVIEDIAVGDTVAARNEFTGETSWRAVKQLFTIEDKIIVNVTLRNDAGLLEQVSATNEHPFFVHQESWRAAKDLMVGDRIALLAGGSAEVMSVELNSTRARAYNFEVADVHTYFVGQMGVWVVSLLI